MERSAEISDSRRNAYAVFVALARFPRTIWPISQRANATRTWSKREIAL
jgi:hypothetical protein